MTAPSKMKCPYCGSKNIACDEVDIGVGMQQCGPYGCENCHAVEMYADDPKATAEERETRLFT